MSNNSHQIYKLNFLEMLGKSSKHILPNGGCFSTVIYRIIPKKSPVSSSSFHPPSAPARGWRNCTTRSHTRHAIHEARRWCFLWYKGMQKREFVASLGFLFPGFILKTSKETRKSKWVLSQRVCRNCPMIFFFIVTVPSLVLYFYGVLREVPNFWDFETSPKYTSK